jgi:hypothetical protein
LGGDYVIWIQRCFVWLQFAIIAWCWTTVIADSFEMSRSPLLRLPLAFMAYVFGANFFALIAWHSIDGLCAASLGVAFCSTRSRPAKYFGYLLIGSTPLFRQNFLPLIPVSVVLFGDWRRIRCWIAVLLPVSVYIIAMAAVGALPEFLRQVSSRGVAGFWQTRSTLADTWRTGIARYIGSPDMAWGVLFGLIATMMARGDFHANREPNPLNAPRLIGAALLLTLPIWLVVLFRRWGFELYQSFFVFGAVVGATAYLAYAERRVTPRVRAGLLILAAGWCASLSLGGNDPSLSVGGLLLFLIGCSSLAEFAPLSPVDSPASSETQRRLRRQVALGASAILVVVVLSSAALHYKARRDVIYSEPHAVYLTKDLSGVLPGARLIKTNPATFERLSELRQLEDSLAKSGKTYAIVPDYPVNWVKSSQPNPLPCDWPAYIEMAGRVDRVTQAIAARKGTLVVLVQKQVNFSSLIFEMVPLSDSIYRGIYPVVDYVRSHLTKTGETRFFELYE